MARNREMSGSDGARMPDPGKILEAQRTAAENAAHMASTACRYAMSMNRAWLNLWNNQLSHYTQLPERFVDAQTHFVEQAFDTYQESVQQLSGLAMQAQREAEGIMHETQEAGERTAQQFRMETNNMAKGYRPKENRQGNAGEDQPAPEQHEQHAPQQNVAEQHGTH